MYFMYILHTQTYVSIKKLKFYKYTQQLQWKQSQEVLRDYSCPQKKSYG